MQRLNYCLGIDQVRQGCRGNCLFTLIQRPTVLCKCVNYTILERVLLISHLFQSLYLNHFTAKNITWRRWEGLDEWARGRGNDNYINENIAAFPLF